jgi:hypothetical protein
MIELELYAAGIRQLDKILALDHALEAVGGLRYKVDSNHDIVYFEMDEPVTTAEQLLGVFRKLGFQPRIVGSIPAALQVTDKKKTQPLPFV